jgi:ABC-type multidrug transport system ATPase subunit
MRQKLAIARALLHEPRVLFLDEPTAGLDPEASKLVRDFIEELSGEGRTIFLTTHNLDEADRLCDRIAVFNTRLRVVDSTAGLASRCTAGKSFSISPKRRNNGAPFSPTSRLSPICRRSIISSSSRSQIRKRTIPS